MNLGHYKLRGQRPTSCALTYSVLNVFKITLKANADKGFSLCSNELRLIGSNLGYEIRLFAYRHTSQ